MAVKQTYRGLVSLNLVISGLISIITGIVLYFMPEGRVAYWIIWELLGLTKDQWQSLHTLSSYLLLVFMILHTINNWSSIKNYIFRKEGGFNQKTSIVLAILFSAIIVVSGIFYLPPLQYVVDFGAWLKGLWVTAPELEPPFGHAEAVPLKSFCMRMRIDFPTALETLRANGISVDDDGKQTLEDLARAHGKSPLDVYLYIRELEEKIEPEAGIVWTEEQIDAQFAGIGLGRKTLEQIAEMVGMNVEEAAQILSGKGINVEPGQTIKQIADSSDLVEKPIDVLKALLLK
jgi:hypothetical protein